MASFQSCSPGGDQCWYILETVHPSQYIYFANVGNTQGCIISKRCPVSATFDKICPKWTFRTSKWPSSGGLHTGVVTQTCINSKRWERLDLSGAFCVTSFQVNSNHNLCAFFDIPVIFSSPFFPSQPAQASAAMYFHILIGIPRWALIGEGYGSTKNL